MVYLRETDSPFVYHFVFFEHGGENKNKGRKEGGRMRIDSSAIGMDSTRKYTSVSGRVTKLMISNGRQSLMGGTGAMFGNALGTDVEGSEKQMGEKENPEDTLQSTFEEMRSKIRPIASESTQGTGISSAREQLMEIRQQCINYLMDILFPGKMGRRNWASEVMSSSNLYTGSLGGAKTFTLSNQSYYAETEETSFSTQGTVRCADGREISFNLNLEMSRSFQEYYEVTSSITQAPLCDPLVINLNGNIPELSDQTFKFDIDGDGQEDEINRLGAGSGFIALDKNGDGIINDGSELFGTKSGNGFADLAAYDEDHNGFIDEGDAIWDKLKIWVMDENGNQQLYSLAEKGVGAICLQNASTNYSITDENNQTKGVIRNTGVFLYENGNVGTIQHVDLALHEQKKQENIQKKQSKYAQWMYAMAN
ncbi:hypothetical protein D5281_04655 [bacterium 1xD42-62]|uniref:VCBS repeat-containing protein n=2 Tax=Parablautia muri TaxID=2320879 RepID=A0A9X5GRB9_9FIRM|nr:hypothetical protein [Parablautia muri]